MQTCAAVATAPGKAGISVIRLSGDDSIEIAAKVFRPASGKALTEIPANTAVYGKIVGADGKKIDGGMCTCFYAPKSYTGENTVEISCHGSPVGTSLVLSAVFAAGAKPALAGEFTKRAFVNGKLDLTQAEAVAALIDAKSAAALKLSSNQLDGVVSGKIKKCADEITMLLASLYAYIDYPDEDMTDIPLSELKDMVLKIRKDIDSLASTYSTGLAISDGVKAAIVGSPNTGKSSFLNMLSGFERAIVTDIAGTTRDVVSENVCVGNIRLLLSDTAGIRETSDTVEKIGVKRSLEELENSELAFCMFDASRELTKEETEFCGRLSEYKDTKNIIIVINKCDAADFAKHKEFFASRGFDNIVCISAKTGFGKEEITAALEKIYPGGENIENAAILTNARQFSALCEARESFDKAIDALNTLTPDAACLDMEAALARLYEADGRRVSEEIVNGIFSHFCVGK